MAMGYANHMTNSVTGYECFPSYMYKILNQNKLVKIYPVLRLATRALWHSIPRIHPTIMLGTPCFTASMHMV